MDAAVDGAADSSARDTGVPPDAGDTAATGDVFPLHVSADRRYLVTAGDAPFFIQGDTPWSLMVELTREEVTEYLDDRVAHGFNAILVNLIEARFSATTPPWATAYGDVPFDDVDDFSVQNEAYFAHTDWVLAEASRRGMLVLLTPAYMGYGCGDEGWCAAMRNNGVDNLRAYGRFLGTRYRDQTNIIWVHGGDHRPSTSGSPSDWDLMDAIRLGLTETDRDDRIVTAHWSRGDNGSEADEAASWLTLDSIYSADGASIYEESLDVWGRSQGVRPGVLIESYYENEHGMTPQRLRSEMYWPVLAGSTGFFYGNYPIWPFWNAGDPDWGFGDGGFSGGWREALDNPGASAARIAGGFFRDRDWQRLVPDTAHAFLTDGLGSSGSESYVLCAATPEGDLAVAYFYDGSSSPTVDLGAFAGATVSISWVDPADGSVQPLAGSPFTTDATMSVSPPGDNADGDADWLLLFESPP